MQLPAPRRPESPLVRFCDHGVSARGLFKSACFVAPLALLPMIDGVAAETGSHCRAGEKIFFNAQVVDSKKVVSVCGTIKTETLQTLQYRFGVPGSIELQFPERSSRSAGKFIIRRYTRARTTYLKLEFDKSGRNYEVVEGYEADSQPSSTAALQVKKSRTGKDVAEFPLQMSSEALQLMQLEKWLPTQPFDE